MHLTIGIVLLVVGFALLYVVFGGSFMTHFMPSGRPSTYDLAVGALAWAFAFSAPTGFIFAGALQLAKARRKWQARN